MTNLYEIDSLNNLHLKCQKPGNYNISMGNSRHQYLFIGTDEIVESVEPIYLYQAYGTYHCDDISLTILLGF